VVERRSLAGELSPSCARPAADGWLLLWIKLNHWLQVNSAFHPFGVDKSSTSFNWLG